jgi:hypothetical protein
MNLLVAAGEFSDAGELDTARHIFDLEAGRADGRLCGWEDHRAQRTDSLVLGLRGRPPRLPFSRDAAAFRGLRFRPPAAPRRPAIQLFEPSMPPISAGT